MGFIGIRLTLSEAFLDNQSIYEKIDLTHSLNFSFFSFPLDLNAGFDDQEDVDDDDIHYDDEQMIDIADDLLYEEESDEDEESDDDESTNTVNNIDDEYDEDLDDGIDFSALSISNHDSSNVNHYDLLLNVFHLMKRIRSSVKFIRNHNVTNEYMTKSIKEKNNKRNAGGLVLDLSIRWNSSFLMINRLLIHREIVVNIFVFPNNLIGLTEKQKRQLYELMIKQNEWNLLGDLKSVLEPFQVATTVLSGQKYPTMAISFVVWRLLYKFLQSSTTDMPIVAALKTCLRFRFQLHCEKNLPPGQLEIMKVILFCFFVSVTVVTVQHE